MNLEEKAEAVESLVDAAPVEQQDAPEAAPVEQEAAPQDSDAAAFDEGFNAARGIEPSPEPEPPKLFGKFTEAEVRALLEKAGEVDKLREREAKVFGTLGSLKQAVDQLRSQPQAAPRFSGDMPRMSAEYPELAEALRADFAAGMPGGVPAQDAESIERMLSERLQAVERTNEQKLLSVMHPGWQQLHASPEFTQWKGTLAPDELQVVEDSWDAIELGQALSKFKSWKDQANQTKLSRQSRLESAITPKGSRQVTSTETPEDAFYAGIRSVRGR